MAEIPNVTPELERHIARKLTFLNGLTWRELTREDRQAHIKKARQLLNAERKFLTRDPSEAADGEDADDA